MDLGKYCRELLKRMRSSADSAEESVLSALDNAGQRLVEIARNTKTYKDNTGNLTASIGYGVYHRGKRYSVGGFGYGEGGQKGLEKLESVAAEYSSRPFLLIVVAGMDYAIYVERSGYVVLDAAMLQKDSVLNAELKRVKIK